jgi:subtilase family serine protease
MKLKKSMCAMVVVVMAAAVTATGSSAQENFSGGSRQTAAANARLAQTVPPWLKKAKELGEADDRKRVMITAYLSWRNQSELQQVLQDQSTPGNPQYGHFLTPEEFHARFSPKAEEVSVVQGTLRGLGFNVEYTPDSGLFVRASGTVAHVRQAFQVSHKLYSYQGKTLRAHEEEPTVPRLFAASSHISEASTLIALEATCFDQSDLAAQGLTRFALPRFFVPAC